MEMLPGSSMKATDLLGTTEKIPGNTETNPPTMPPFSYIGRKVKILIVDDDESLRRIMARHLDYIGFGMVEANNGFIGQYLF